MKYLTPKELEGKLDKEYPDSRDIFGSDPYSSRRKAIKDFIHQQRIQDLESVEEMIKEILPENHSPFTTDDAIEKCNCKRCKVIKLLQALMK